MKLEKLWTVLVCFLLVCTTVCAAEKPWERLQADWEALRDDPYALLKLRIESAGMSGIALDFPPESK